MNRVLLILLALAAAAGGAYYYAQSHSGSAASSPLPATQHPELAEPPAPPPAQAEAASPAPAAAPEPPPPASPKNQVTLRLKNGGLVTGELVRETPAEVVLRWDYGEVGFARAEIAQILQGKQDTDGDDVTMPWEGAGQNTWPYHADVVAQLTRGTIVDAKITSVSPEALILTQTVSGGGALEHTIQRRDVEQLLFRPIQNERSQQIEETLRTLFPKMDWHPEGLFTIVTDSAAPAVKDYRRTIRDLSTEWYLTFFPLLGDRTPMAQQYLVIFDDWGAYIEYAASDGVPGWLTVGYFNPEDEVLYCFNMLGERFSALLHDAYLGQFREARDRVSEQIKGSRDAIFIEGQISEFLRKLESAHAILRQTYGQISTDILRHELTHAMFHNWQLQGVVLSQMPEASPEDIEQKRQYLTATDQTRKRQALEELLKRQGRETLPDQRASNSWFVEGLAGYMEPSPIGDLNVERLVELQEARATQSLLPLEFLHAFRLGSFPGMATQSKLYAYAQSWALCHFLMSRYRDGFLAYLDRIAREDPGEGVDTLPWLCAAVGKEQRALEQEFAASLDQFPPERPLWLKQLEDFLDLRAELIALAQRLWGY